ncbi:hypothetical protein CDAR_561631 [Caerostris darwini]|uniref:Uncharacterized protein n=1 Tax=Caerostris darwini TaxID=1538125 RepID=A0AAV4MJK6_9ARAC|nr:hypothetical protein CDAR_561631 [Caerostris darwini]
MWVRLRSSRNPFPTHMSVVGVTSVYFCANVTEPSTCLVNKRHRLHPIRRLLTPLRHLPPGPIITAALTSLNVTTRPCRAHSSISLAPDPRNLFTTADRSSDSAFGQADPSDKAVASS